MVSIIIPAYNCEKYLPACLDSVCAQTYPDWEAVVVDDGSTDGTGSIAERYAANDRRIKVIHQKNQGSSIARNVGLANAHGEYLYMLDGDDIICPRLLEFCVKALERTPEASFACFDYTCVQPQERMPDASLSLETIRCKKIVDPFLWWLKTRRNCNIWTNVYRRSSLNGLLFKPRIKHQDLLFTYQYLARDIQGVYIPLVLHGYVQSQGSITRSPMTFEKIRTIFGILQDLDDYYANAPVKQKMLRRRLFTRTIKSLGVVVRNDPKYYNYFSLRLRSFFDGGHVGYRGFPWKKKMEVYRILKANREVGLCGFLEKMLKTFSSAPRKVVGAEARNVCWREISDAATLPRNPLVSVVMTAYNNEKDLYRAVRSVVEQKAPFPFEVLVGVDVCKDDSLAVAKKCQAEWPDKVRVFYPSENVGYQKNRDHLHSAARATGGVDGRGYFAYCEADDAWDMCTTKLAEQIDLLTRHADWVGCVGPVRRVRDGRESLPGVGDLQLEEIKQYALGERYFHTTSYVFRRATYEKCHEMAPDLPVWMDMLILIGANTVGPIGFWPKVGSTQFMTGEDVCTSLKGLDLCLWELPFYLDWLRCCTNRAGRLFALDIMFRIYRRKGRMAMLWTAQPKLMRRFMVKLARTRPCFSRKGVSARMKILFSRQYR